MENHQIRALITAWYGPMYGGNFIGSLLALAQTMKNNGDYVCFIFPKKADGTKYTWSQYLENHGFEVILFDENRDQKEIKEDLIQIIKSHSINLIHNHFSYLDNLLKWDSDIHKMVKIVYHDHMDFVPDKPVSEQIKKQMKLAKRYKQFGIGVISVMKRIHKWYFFCPNRWYIHNAITFERNVEKPLSREEYREKIGLSKDDKLVLFLGWDIFRKGLDIAVRAVQQVRKKHPNVYLGVSGFGSNPSDESLEKIAKVIGMDASNPDGVIYLDDTEDAYALHKAADIYLSASRKEAFAYGILVSISQNTPVVVSDIPGTKWSYKFSKCRHFKSENQNQCADAILASLDDKEKTSNYKEILAQYSIEKWCEEVIKVYRKMLNG